MTLQRNTNETPKGVPVMAIRIHADGHVTKPCDRKDKVSGR